MVVTTPGRRKLQCRCGRILLSEGHQTIGLCSQCVFESQSRRRLAAPKYGFQRVRPPPTEGSDGRR